jgi:hypothetical protein
MAISTIKSTESVQSWLDRTNSLIASDNALIDGTRNINIGSLKIDNGSIQITSILSESDLNSNSDSVIPTQKSVKSYQDNRVGTGGHSLPNTEGKIVLNSDGTFKEVQPEIISRNRKFGAGGVWIGDSDENGVSRKLFFTQPQRNITFYDEQTPLEFLFDFTASTNVESQFVDPWGIGWIMPTSNNGQTSWVGPWQGTNFPVRNAVSITSYTNDDAYSQYYYDTAGDWHANLTSIHRPVESAGTPAYNGRTYFDYSSPIPVGMVELGVPETSADTPIEFYPYLNASDVTNRTIDYHTMSTSTHTSEFREVNYANTNYNYTVRTKYYNNQNNRGWMMPLGDTYTGTRHGIRVIRTADWGGQWDSYFMRFYSATAWDDFDNMELVTNKFVSSTMKYNEVPFIRIHVPIRDQAHASNPMTPSSTNAEFVEAYLDMNHRRTIHDAFDDTDIPQFAISFDDGITWSSWKNFYFDSASNLPGGRPYDGGGGGASSMVADMHGVIAKSDYPTSVDSDEGYGVRLKFRNRNNKMIRIMGLQWHGTSEITKYEANKMGYTF